MKKILFGLLFMLPLLAFVGCSDDDHSIVGTWLYTKIDVVTIETDHSQKDEFIKEIESDVSATPITFHTNGTVTSISDDTKLTASYSVKGSTLTVINNGETRVYTDLTISGNTMHFLEDITDLWEPPLDKLIVKHTLVRQ